MNTRMAQTVLICINLALVMSCSFAPLTPRVDAASIGKHELKIESNFTPTPSLGLIYGVDENLDIGLEVEQNFLSTAWARYSIINNPNGFSLAGNGAVFVGTGEYPSNGWYTGLLLSNQINPSVRWSAGVRYAVLDYEYGDLSSNDWWGSDVREFDNPDDASHNAQVDLSMSWRLKPHVELALGASCQHLIKNTNELIRDRRCYPIIGLSFYRL